MQGQEPEQVAMVVKLPFPDPNTFQKGKSRKRISHATAKLQRREKNKLLTELTIAKKKLNTTRRQNQRLKEKLTQVSQITPEKEARRSLSDVGLSPEDVPSLHRELVALHSVAKEIKVAHDEQKDVTLSMTSAKKTRSISTLSQITEINVKKLHKSVWKRSSEKDKLNLMRTEEK